MSKWTDPDEWAKLCSGETCEICVEGGPRHPIAEMESSWLCSGQNVCVRGYCCLFSRRHAVELHDLTEDEGAAYMRDLQKVSRAIKAVTGAVKMNYEIHGNTLPHVHTHLYPRYVGDPFEEEGLKAGVVTSPVYAPGEFEEFVARLQEALGEPGAA